MAMVVVLVGKAYSTIWSGAMFIIIFIFQFGEITTLEVRLGNSCLVMALVTCRFHPDIFITYVIPTITVMQCKFCNLLKLYVHYRVKPL